MDADIKKIVELVMKELQAAQSAPVSPGCPAATDDGEPLSDIGAVDLQRYLQVPEPKSLRLYEQMKLQTPARIGAWRTGTRPLTDTLIRFRADHAAAQDSVMSEIPQEFPDKFNMLCTRSRCIDKDQYLTRPDLGRLLDDQSLSLLRIEADKNAEVQIIVSDGLSARAVEANVPDVLPSIMQGLQVLGIKTARPIFVHSGRVAVMDVIGEELRPKVAVILIGERPGLATAESMSAYLGYNPRKGMLESERMVISNIHKGGTPAVEAGAHLATLIQKMLQKKASGVNLTQLS
ncbi:MAG: ethanolamine ammonia-lyase subunit EutC [Bacillota bacterium]